MGIAHGLDSVILEAFSNPRDSVVTEIPFSPVLCCSHRCHLPAGGGLGTEAAAPHSDHPREHLQEVTQEGQPSSGVCHWGWGPEPSPGKEGSSKLTKLQTVAPGGPGQHGAHPALQCSWCVCWWACLVLMLGTEETSWLLSRS